MEYKFRAKNKDSGKWVCGCFVKSVNDRAYIVIYATEDAINTRNELDFIYTEVIPETIGMFTGLTDKNNVEIYEGDLLKTEENDIYRVSFVESSCAFIACFYPDDYDTVYLTDTCPNTYDEVIGNIHD